MQSNMETPGTQPDAAPGPQTTQPAPGATSPIPAVPDLSTQSSPPLDSSTPSSARPAPTKPWYKRPVLLLIVFLALMLVIFLSIYFNERHRIARYLGALEVPAYMQKTTELGHAALADEGSSPPGMSLAYTDKSASRAMADLTASLEAHGFTVLQKNDRREPKNCTYDSAGIPTCKKTGEVILNDYTYTFASKNPPSYCQRLLVTDYADSTGYIWIGCTVEAATDASGPSSP